MIYTRFYDSVLTQIEVGKVQDGINLLVGMLDTVDLQAGSLARAERELRNHSLCQMLLEDPMIAHAEAQPDNPADRLKMIFQSSVDGEVSSTGRRLFAVTRELTFACGLRERHDSFRLKLRRAWQTGQPICLIDDSDALLEGMDGQDGANITVVGLADVRHFFAAAAKDGTRFDLILAPNLLDRHGAPALQTRFALMQSCLSEQGSIVLAGLIPQHLGAGWRSACLNWNPQCHNESDLERLASGAGMAARTYRDETDCILWAELRNASQTGDTGGINHAR
jgi:hypothetical protein